jgi:hypothetical protein
MEGARMQTGPPIAVMIGPALVISLWLLLERRKFAGEATTRQQLRTIVTGFGIVAVYYAAILLYHATSPGIDEVIEHIWTLAGITMTIGAFASAIVHIIMPVERDGPGSTESFGLPPVRIRAAKGALSAPRPRMFRPLRALVCVVALASAPNDWLAPFMVLGVFLASDGLAEGWFNPKRWTAVAPYSPRTVATEQAEISRIIARAQRTRTGTDATPPAPPAAR